MNKIRLAFLYNRRKEYPKNSSDPLDIDAEWDDDDTIDEIEKVLKESSFDVVSHSNPEILLDQDFRKQIDLVFSICEMRGGSFRESIVPAICEFVNLPYMFSPPDVMATALDKNITNLLLQQAGINIPTWYLIANLGELNKLKDITDYPYIVKPAAEGSGKGIDEKSIVYNYSHLVDKAKWVATNYTPPVMIQKFITGPEITIAITQIDGEIVPMFPVKIKSILENDISSMQNVSDEYQSAVVVEIKAMAVKVFETLRCLDIARIDIRLSDKLEPFVLDVNLVPLLHPTIGYFAESIKQAGYSYKEVIRKVIISAYNRQINNQHRSCL